MMKCVCFILQEDEVDPLDAFMSGIQEEVRKINRVDMRGGVMKSTKPICKILLHFHLLLCRVFYVTECIIF